MARNKKLKKTKSLKAKLMRKPYLIFVLVFAVLGLCMLRWSLAATAPRSFYVDCSTGHDTADGLTPTTAWSSIKRLNTATLLPGDKLFLKRNCTWSGPLQAKWSGTASQPIYISAYSTGSNPKIYNGDSSGVVVHVTGNYLNLNNLNVAATKPPDTLVGCPTGWRVGFSFEAGGNNTLKNSTATGLTAGVHLVAGSNNNHIIGNTLTDNNVLSVNTPGGNDDSGAWGILVNSDNNQISQNTFARNEAHCSYDFGSDGSAVEIFGASGNVISQNKSVNDLNFSELGSSPTKYSSNNIFAFNVFSSSDASSQFIIVRGSGTTFGPTPNTQIYNNSVYSTGSSSQGVICLKCSSAILTLKNNILWANWKSLYADASFAESNNIYWRTGGAPLVQLTAATLSSTSKKVNPLLIDPSKLNFNLQSISPARNAGSTDVFKLGIKTDAGNYQFPVNIAPDIGAFQYL